jgi:predicted dienelactone hydrolase
VIRGSGHLNFTDLPLFSPALARMLGTGQADSRYCIETMNQIVLEFFNHTLKGRAEIHLQPEY